MCQYLLLNQMLEFGGGFDASNFTVHKGWHLLFDTLIVGFDGLTEFVGAIFVLESGDFRDRLVLFHLCRDLGDLSFFAYIILL